ncbi:hypothetical protein [[Clostridium] polysaccharolyticum]|uniref:Uncharacterized protein n=1 Tax=[Clostridium] polysaccharolyticum TaxID=29364 RepID=A0A1H9ZX27_9FIRM|nr:hypothetical protein [[Clostridium] polysaccharolyticum]SES86363.1 hypothetical protein SAMN04487772_104152 [[Clostridium] polysaccharolyticum]
MNKKKFRTELLWESPFLTLIYVLFYSVFIFLIVLLLAGAKNEKVIPVSITCLRTVLIGFLFAGILTASTCLHFMLKRKQYLIYYVAGASYRMLITYITAKQYIMLVISLSMNLLYVNFTDFFYNVLHTGNSFRDLVCYSIAGMFICCLLNVLVSMCSFVLIKQLHPFSERWER